MPAAAVIPAPIAYIKVVAVKKLVVGTVSRTVGAPFMVFTDMLRDVLPVGLLPPFGRLFFLKAAFNGSVTFSCHPSRCSLLSVVAGRHVYFEQIRVLKAGLTPEYCVHGIIE